MVHAPVRARNRSNPLPGPVVQVSEEGALLPARRVRVGSGAREPGNRDRVRFEMSAASVPEADDVELAAAGDEEAFRRLYERSVSRIHSLARRMAGAELADDLTQEVFIRAWNKLSTFRGDAAFTTWLHRLAVNLILTRRKSVRRRQAKRVDSDAVLGRAEARRVQPGLRMDFEEAIAGLPDGAREIFVLYDVEGYRHREIAEIVGVSVGTSKSQLHRARMLLRQYLD